MAQPFPTVPFVDPITGKPHIQWQDYLLSLSTGDANIAPADAQYLVATSEPGLTNDRNLAALITGFLFITVAAGVATPSSTLSGALLTALNASSLASGTVPDARFPGTLPAASGANLTNLQGATLEPSGTWTPTLTHVTNLAASTAVSCQYVRIGNSVMCSGSFSADPTAAGATELGMSLPISSNFGAVEDAGGVAFASGIAGQGAAVLADAANNRLSIQWVAVDVTNQPMSFSVLYRVI